MNGTVVAFDERRGLGAVRGDDGVEYPFHCTQIADGTRRVEVSAPVCFELVPGHLGRIEARAIRPR